MADEKAPPIRRPGKGKGKALNAIAAASGRDPAAIVKSVTEAEAKAAAAVRAQQEEEARRIAEIEAAKEAKAREEVTTSQLFNRLSPQEQYRFECYRRCGFASKPIEKFVAKMLVEEAEKRYLVRRGAMVGLGGKMSGDIIGGGSYDVLNKNNNTASVQDDTSDSNQNKKRRKQSTKHILREESKRRRIAMDQPLPYFSSSSGRNVGNGNGDGTSSGQTPPLSNLVVPNSASEIVAVVSTLAKCYAQRLVSAAKRVADAEEEERKMTEEEGTTDTDATSLSSSTITATPLQPHHFLEAHRHRARAGIDPGFWMASEGSVTRRSGGLGYKQGAVGIVEAAAIGTVDRDRENYLAALEAQECCDHKAAKQEEEEKKQEQEEGKEKQQHVSDKMEIDDGEGR